jgi:hypothetical protein
VDASAGSLNATSAVACARLTLPLPSTILEPTVKGIASVVTLNLLAACGAPSYPALDRGAAARTGPAVMATSTAPAPPASAAAGPAFLTDVVQITAGLAHACALHSSGRVSCWGDNGVGQVGVPLANTPESGVFTRPVWVADLPPAKHVEAGFQHTCAMARDDTLWCWGSAGFNVHVSSGSVAGTIDLPYLPRTAHAGQPRMVLDSHARPLRVRAIHLQASDDHVCVATQDDVRTWQSTDWLDPASNGPIELADSTAEKLPGAISVAARGDVTCAIGASSSGHATSCWRDRERPSPVSWPNDAADPVEVRMAEYPLCVLDAAGELRCWRATVSGHFWQKPPVHVTWPSKSPTVAFAVGESAVCSAGRNGKVDCFMAEIQGTTPEERRRMWAGTGMGPHPIAGANDAIAIAMGASRDALGFGFACGALARPSSQGAQVLCWGDNDAGQIGNGTENLTLDAAAVLGPVAPSPQNRRFAKPGADMQENNHGSDWHDIPGSER